MLDTIKFADSLTKAGLAEPIAKGVASSIAEAMETTAVTKSDLENSLLKLETKLDLDNKLIKLESKLTDKINSAMFKVVGLLGGLISIFGLLQYFHN